jgi:hypothetical protein
VRRKRRIAVLHYSRAGKCTLNREAKISKPNFILEEGENRPEIRNDIRTFPQEAQDGDAQIFVAEPLDRAALQIARGVGRYFRALNAAILCELPLADGRRADLMALDPRGGISIVEIKSCMADFRSDRKWPEYRQWCDRFYFAVDADFPNELIPDDCGLILADRFGADIIREAPEHRLDAARRRAVTLRFARCAAVRFHAVNDPEFEL